MSKIVYVGTLRGCLYLQQTPSQTETPPAFHSWLCACLFLALVLWAGQPHPGFKPHAAQGEPLQLRYPSGTSAPICLWGWGQPFLCHCPCQKPVCAFCKPQGSSSASLQLVFWGDCVPFNCISSLVLGEGVFSICLLHRHVKNLYF